VPPAAEQLTFVFTDIEGSTRLLAAAEDAYPALLDGHRAIIRAHVEAHGGMVDSTDGDATFAVFTGAPAAVAAAVAVQRSSRSTGPHGLPPAHTVARSSCPTTRRRRAAVETSS
jgi:class 3 adenylate cyclase